MVFYYECSRCGGDKYGRFDIPYYYISEKSTEETIICNFKNSCPIVEETGRAFVISVTRT